MGHAAGEVRGVGLDMVSVSRFKEAVDRWGERFTGRIFTPAEIAYCRSKARPEIHLAARFAAKEAFLKALGTGLARGIGFRDVEILPGGDGPPKISLHNRALVLSVTSGFGEFHLSLTHTSEFAAACVVATASPGRGGL